MPNRVYLESDEVDLIPSKLMGNAFSLTNKYLTRAKQNLQQTVHLTLVICVMLMKDYLPQ